MRRNRHAIDDGTAEKAGGVRITRKYDIGHGVTIEDDGYVLRASWGDARGMGATSLGVKRPRVGPIPDEVEIKYSIGRAHYYLPEFTSPHGFWFGAVKWKSKEEMKANCKPGVLGSAGHIVTKTSGETYVRERLDFAYWSVKSEQETSRISSSDDLVQDYLCVVLGEEGESAKKFNEEIAFTGRDLAWIMERIGAWVEPVEVPVAMLAD